MTFFANGHAMAQIDDEWVRINKDGRQVGDEKWSEVCHQNEDKYNSILAVYPGKLGGAVNRQFWYSCINCISNWNFYYSCFCPNNAFRLKTKK